MSMNDVKDRWVIPGDVSRFHVVRGEDHKALVKYVGPWTEAIKTVTMTALNRAKDERLGRGKSGVEGRACMLMMAQVKIGMAVTETLAICDKEEGFSREQFKADILDSVAEIVDGIFTHVADAEKK